MYPYLCDTDLCLLGRGKSRGANVVGHMWPPSSCACSLKTSVRICRLDFCAPWKIRRHCRSLHKLEPVTGSRRQGWRISSNNACSRLAIAPSRCGSAAIFVSTGALPVHLASTPRRCASGLKLLEPLSHRDSFSVGEVGQISRQSPMRLLELPNFQRVPMVTAFIHLPIEPSGY